MVPGMDADPITEDTAQAPDIEPWEKTDEALDAAAELMPECPADDGDEGEGDELADGGDA